MKAHQHAAFLRDLERLAKRVEHLEQGAEHAAFVIETAQIARDLRYLAGVLDGREDY
jgi:hypothetical protein